MNLPVPTQITGIGMLGNFGDSPEALLKAAASGVVPTPQFIQGPDTSFPALRADPAGLREYINPRLMRRMDHFCRLSLHACLLAMKDGDIDTGSSQPPDTGLILGTGFGAASTTFAFLDSYIEEGDAFASPAKFSTSLHSIAAANISQTLKLHGPCLTVTAFELTFYSALLTAFAWIKEERVKRVILGMVDEICPVLGYCGSRYFPGAHEAIAPYAFENQTAIVGEGAVFMVLEKACCDKRGNTVAFEAVEHIQAGQDIPLNHAAQISLGLDGHRQTGIQYRPVLEKVKDPLCFSPWVGSLPIGQAFDVAAMASLLRKNESGNSQSIKFHYDGGAVSVHLQCR